MHHKYHTDAFILSSRGVGEADKLFTLYTRDMGKVTARASGVRKISSKLRATLLDHVLVRVDLISSREFWRITSAGAKETFTVIHADRDRYRVLARIMQLIDRFIHGEHADTELFDDVVRFMYALCTPELTRETIVAYEHVFVLRILHRLGYIGETVRFGEFLARDPFERIARMTDAERFALREEIHRAFSESDL
jgi:DNA repair protein RecO (recombination protein O)